MKKTKSIYDLNLLDRFLFAQASEDVEFVELILSIILDTDITLRDQPQPEREQRKRLERKQIKMDVMAVDTDGHVYDTEVQKRNTSNLPRRMRYYHSLIDTALLKEGTRDYNQLNDVYVIVIAPFDPFGRGLYRYTFRMNCVESTDIKLGDGVTTIFLNTRGTDPTGVTEELIGLLKYFEHTRIGDSENNTSDHSDSDYADQSPESMKHRKPDSRRLQAIHKKVEDIRRNEETGVKMMLEWEEREEWREEGREVGLEEGREIGLEIGIKEGRKEGMEESRNEIARSMLENGLPIEIIMKCTGLSEERIATLQQRT